MTPLDHAKTKRRRQRRSQSRLSYKYKYGKSAFFSLLFLCFLLTPNDAFVGSYQHHHHQRQSHRTGSGSGSGSNSRSRSSSPSTCRTAFVRLHSTASTNNDTDMNTDMNMDIGGDGFLSDQASDDFATVKTYGGDGDFDFANFDEQNETYTVNLQLAELARSSNLRNKTAARMAYELLRSSRYPDTVAYNSVLKALAKTSSLYNKKAADLAQGLLEQMEELQAFQLNANQKWYGKLKTGNLTQDQVSLGPPRVRVKPNVRSYSTVMDAWGKQTNPQAALNAQDLLEKLQAKYDATGDVGVRPNVISYNTVINAWAKAGAEVEGVQRCERLLNRMPEPDAISYNAVLHAWARSGLPKAGERAEEILRSMRKVKPNGRTYTTVMDAWSRSFECKDSAQRAHALLSEMEELQKTDNNMKINYISYSTVVNAYALSRNEPLKAHKAFALLQRMLRLSKVDGNVQPNRVTYNSVLNACATSNPVTAEDLLDDRNLISLPDMVRTLYTQLLENDNLRPDHFTFGTVLKAVANLFWGEPDQIEFGKKVFREACARGQVSFGVLSQLRQAMPSEVYRSLLPDKATCDKRPEALLNHIPKEWTRNVREENRRRKNHNSR